MVQKSKVSTAVAFGVLAGVAQVSSAQEVVQLKLADWQPPNHYSIREGAQVFIRRADELSNGKVKIQLFPAEQLGKAKDALMLAQSGVADVVNIAPAYITEKFPLSGVMELPGMYEGACNGAKAFSTMAKPGGVLYEQEFKPNGVRVLFSAPLGAYRVITRERRASTAEDFKGLKLRTAGGPMDHTAALLGANSIRMPGPDVLPSLSRGTLDGLFWPLQAVKPWSLEKNLKFITSNLSVGSFVMVYAMSEKSWQKLPADVQKVLETAGEETTQAHCRYVDASEAKTIEELNAGGIASVALPEGDVSRIQEGYKKIHADWAADLDKRGKQGTPVLEGLRKALATTSNAR